MTETAVLVDIAPPELETATAGGGAAGAGAGEGDCAVGDAIGGALRANPEAAAALAAVPASERTVANALMLWDGQWAAPASAESRRAVGQLRAIIVASIRAAPLACQAAPLTGPRLVIVPDAAGTVVLAFGSGNWSWTELAS